MVERSLSEDERKMQAASVVGVDWIVELASRTGVDANKLFGRVIVRAICELGLRIDQVVSPRVAH